MTETRQQATFVLLCLLSTAVTWRSVIATFSFAIRDSEFTYILLILPVGVALAWLQWKTLKTTSWNVAAGLSLVAIGLLVALSPRLWPNALLGMQLSLNMLALVIWWIAAFVLCFGLRAARLLAFPLCFLLWIVPFPEVALKQMAQLLQAGSAGSATLLFRAVGVPASRDQVFLSIPGLNLEVARECSSLRTSVMLIVTTMVVAQVFLQTPWRRALVILLSLPLSIVKNGIRIFTIGILTTEVDRSYMSGWLHHDGGIVFFLGALAVILVLVWLLRRGEAGTLYIRRSQNIEKISLSLNYK